MLVLFHMQMIGYKVLLKNICPYAPLKLQVIMKMFLLFWLLDITYLCLHHNYICLIFCVSQKIKTDDSLILKFIQKLRTMGY